MTARDRIARFHQEMTTWRRDIHAHPELGFQESRTSDIVAAKLASWGIEVHRGLARTGVVGVLKVGTGKRTVGLRADMDALPMPEHNEFPHRSQNPGKMHACGHDGHMASLLAVAAVLADESTGWRARLGGSVKFLFQPAEEGHGGAREMIADGCLEGARFGPAVDSVYGIHLWSLQALGVVACGHGPIMAASDRFEIAVRGKGGHGAAPHNTVDAIVEAAAVVTALQTVVSRNVDPLEAAVVSCCTIHGGSGYNVITSDPVTITGTARSFVPEVQDRIEERIKAVAAGVAATYGGSAEVSYIRGYPQTDNKYPAAVEAVRAAAGRLVGPDRASVTYREGVGRGRGAAATTTTAPFAARRPQARWARRTSRTCCNRARARSSSSAVRCPGSRGRTTRTCSTLTRTRCSSPRPASSPSSRRTSGDRAPSSPTR